MRSYLESAEAESKSQAQTAEIMQAGAAYDSLLEQKQATAAQHVIDLAWGDGPLDEDGLPIDYEAAEEADHDFLLRNRPPVARRCRGAGLRGSRLGDRRR